MAQSDHSSIKRRSLGGGLRVKEVSGVGRVWKKYGVIEGEFVSGSGHKSVLAVSGKGRQ